MNSYLQSVQEWAWGMTNIFISSKMGQICLPYIIQLGTHFILLQRKEVRGQVARHERICDTLF